MPLDICNLLSAAQAAQKKMLDMKLLELRLSAAQAAQKYFVVTVQFILWLSAAQAAQKLRSS